MKKLSAVLFIFILFSMLKNGSAQDIKPERIQSDQLKQTAVTSCLEDNIVNGRNLLYCSTFQIAWNALCDDIIKEPLQLKGNPPTAQMLNERLAGKEDISEDCYLSMAGFNKDGIVEKIKEALKEKFNETPGIDISLTRPDDILSYAFLLKELKFKKDFESLDKPIMFNGSIPVQAFGIKEYAYDEGHMSLGEQVSILYYNNDSDFIVSLKPDSPKDEIIIAEIAPQKTMLEAINSVFNKINTAQPSSLNAKETLQIPKLDFGVLHSYSELVGKDVLNKGFESYSIAKAIQSIRFRLNEKGALLKSEAAIVARTAILADGPRNFIFDKPFLICLKEKVAKYPYFAMWVDNAELLLKE